MEKRKKVYKEQATLSEVLFECVAKKGEESVADRCRAPPAALV